MAVLRESDPPLEVIPEDVSRVESRHRHPNVLPFFALPSPSSTLNLALVSATGISYPVAGSCHGYLDTLLYSTVLLSTVDSKTAKIP
ncbi:predicted protein [Plenodomus lingam JN3]|uniref:Predicted protein n=1 Tax=Leptosphaeria maculans (strain JN3 / isolate v23.1.3 / race Av1-4-5-6-7-8) TaxID=985895 RepID=E5ACN0_LEPMJ|nr:predicted protein [Plenodomus lingam JN3]CBY02232.1 predicted protein [Plenodomus lingam JN3]